MVSYGSESMEAGRSPWSTETRPEGTVWERSPEKASKPSTTCRFKSTHAATVLYARDGVELCGFGLGEEVWRWGREPDLLLPELVNAHVLQSDGTTLIAAEGEHHTDTYRRTLGVIEQRFDLSLSPAYLKEARLPHVRSSRHPEHAHLSDCSSRILLRGEEHVL